jgi:hypothetical protein
MGKLAKEKKTQVTVTHVTHHSPARVLYKVKGTRAVIRAGDNGACFQTLPSLQAAQGRSVPRKCILRCLGTLAEQLCYQKEA